MLLSLCTISLVGVMVARWRATTSQFEHLLARQVEDMAVQVDQGQEVWSRTLRTYATDYAWWDDLVDFVQEPSDLWFDENLRSSLTTFHMQGMWVFAPDGTFIRGCDVLAASSAVPFGPDVVRKAAAHLEYPHFFLQTEHGLLEVAGAPIHPNSDAHRTSPARGYLFAGRYYTREAMKELSALLHVEATLEAPGTPARPLPFGRISKTIDLCDDQGRTVATIRYKQTVPGLAEAKRSIDSGLILHGGVAVGIVLLLVLYLNLWVMRPLGLLSRGLGQQDADSLSTLEANEDEYGELARMIRFYAERRELLRELEYRRSIESSLREAKEESDLANRTKSEFLASMSHEIRTPMNGILALTELVLETTSLSEDQAAHLKVVHRSASTLLELINDILDLSKIEAGKMEASIEEFELRRELEDHLHSLKTRAEQKGLSFRLEVDEAVPAFVVSEPHWIRQVLVNLVGNAIKFTSHGEVEVRVACVRCHEVGHADQLQFSVIDSGIGIAEDHRESVFNPFTQADRSISAQYGGTGLGLAICRELVRRLGGRIWVESRKGQGSAFHFVLPVGRAAERDAA